MGFMLIPARSWGNLRTAQVCLRRLVLLSRSATLLAPVDAVTPVPPLATANVPDNVTAPVVAVLGVNPVVPAENEVTPPVLAAHVAVVPLDVST